MIAIWNNQVIAESDNTLVIEGNHYFPKDTDWIDVADLNYDNQDMRKEMIADMSYWLTEEGVDGFGCDVAGSVPLDFWQQIVSKLRA